MLPSTIGSSTPVTVTVCATFQFAVVNVSDTGATVPSVRSLDDNPTVTFAVGWLVRTTVNVAVPPASGVVSHDVALTVTVCATFQFAVVNVRLAGATVPSVRSELVNPTVTLAVGWLVSTAVNVAVPPASVVVSPDVGFTVIPATS